MNNLDRLHYPKEDNYTELRKDFFGDKTVREINSVAIEHAIKYPFAPTRISHE